MKIQELNDEQKKTVNGGTDDSYTGSDGSSNSGNDTGGYPTSDGVGQTNESTYGTPDGPQIHRIP